MTARNAEKCFIMKSFPGGDLSVVKVKERIELLIFEDSLSVRGPQEAASHGHLL